MDAMIQHLISTLHCVRVVDLETKEPGDTAWQESPWQGRGPYAEIGWMPGRSDVAGVDIDPREDTPPLAELQKQVRDVLGEPAARYPTPKGGEHWLYPLRVEVGGGQVLPNGKLTVGELRGDNGYLVMWGEAGKKAALQAASMEKRGAMTRAELLMKLEPLREGVEKAPGRPATASGGRRRGSWEGDRHNGLFIRVRNAVAYDLDPEPAIAYAIADARAAGYPEKDTERDVADARRLGQVERDRDPPGAQLEAGLGWMRRREEARAAEEAAAMERYDADEAAWRGEALPPLARPQRKRKGKAAPKPRDMISATACALMMLKANVAGVRTMRYVWDDEGVGATAPPKHMKQWVRNEGWRTASVELMRQIGIYAEPRLGSWFTYEQNGKLKQGWKAAPKEAQHSRFAREVVLQLALQPEICTFEGAWDADSSLIGDRNGHVWHVPTGAKVRDPASRMVKMRLGAVPKPPSKRLKDALRRLFRDERDLKAFLVWCSKSLHGDDLTRQALVLLGKTGTWKSTLAKLASNAFGDYALTVPPEVMVSTRKDDSFEVTSVLGQMAKRRLGLCAEAPTDKGNPMPFSPKQFLPLTGGDGAAGRVIAGNTKVYNWSLLVACNVLPLLPKDEWSAEAIRQRLLVLPMDCQDRDPALRSFLTSPEAAAELLGWLFETMPEAMRLRGFDTATPNGARIVQTLKTVGG